MLPPKALWMRKRQRSRCMNTPSFDQFLETKPLYYKEIDHRRVVRAYALLRKHISHPRAVHIVGTNGKGSTGRMIAFLAYKGGLKVGHFSSPHILKFNERIWINGEDCSDEALEAAHQRLYEILGGEISHALSYFEYTTLLALVVFEKLDLIVLEAGLGGEFDATNVRDKELSVITPIGIDHQQFLGDTIEEIASTKLRSVQKRVLLAPQVYPEVAEIAREITDAKQAELLLSNFLEDASIVAGLERIAGAKQWGEFLISNAAVALEALEMLSIPYDMNDLKSLELFGRFYPLAPNIRIDVGHNPLAAEAIVRVLEEKSVLIYNSLDDKDFGSVLQILKPKVKRVEIIAIESQRAVAKEALERALQSIGLPYCDFVGKINDEEKYLVFGSFYTVEAFLKRYSTQMKTGNR